MVDYYTWARDDFDNGKLRLLYRHQRFIDEGWMGHHVLDIGGWGKMAYRLAQDGRDVILLNISFEGSDGHLERLWRKSAINRFKLLFADAHDMPFRNEVFDTVHSSEMLEHVRSPEIICEEVFRVLRLCGYFCGSVPIPGHCHNEGELGIRFFNYTELKQLLVPKFKILKMEETSSIMQHDEEPSSIMFVAQKRFPF